MIIAERQSALDSALLAFRDLWHPQPFCQRQPAWSLAFPALTHDLMALDEATAAHLNDDDSAALALLARHIPDVSAMAFLSQVPPAVGKALPSQAAHWAWEIPGRKQAQIEAFATAVSTNGQPVLDWCGGKGHLGRLLAMNWQVPVQTLEINADLGEAGQALARRAAVSHDFVVADALTTTTWPQSGQHAVALHACGDLHRRLVRESAAKGLRRLDVAPCCYYRGLAESYQTLSNMAKLTLSRDDVRLAVTETVTAVSREVRQRDQAMAWKLGFDAYRRSVLGDEYRPFKPVTSSWMRGDFANFLSLMAQREGLPEPSRGAVAEFEKMGWQRQGELIRLSIVRHAFRRSIEVWLALDLAGYLEEHGYRVDVSVFCERRLTPRNLLISARLI